MLISIRGISKVGRTCYECWFKGCYMCNEGSHWFGLSVLSSLRDEGRRGGSFSSCWVGFGL